LIDIPVAGLSYWDSKEPAVVFRSDLIFENGLRGPFYEGRSMLERDLFSDREYGDAAGRNPLYRETTEPFDYEHEHRCAEHEHDVVTPNQNQS
jgi:hypothetical protein